MKSWFLSHMRCYSINMHVQLSSMTKGPIFGMIIYLRHSVLYNRNEGHGKTDPLCKLA